MIDLEYFANAMFATLVVPVVKESVQRITFAHHSRDGIVENLQDIVGNEMEIIDINPVALFSTPFSSGRTYSIKEAFRILDTEAFECDVSLRALDVHPTVFSFGKKGYTLIGESRYVDGRIYENAIKMQVLPIG